MIHRLAGVGARHPRAVLLAALAVIGLGELARRRIVLDVIDDLSDPRVALVAEWPYHGAAEVATRVTSVLTAALDDVPGATVRGSAMAGLGYIDVVFASTAQLARGRPAIEQQIAAMAARLPAEVRVRIAPEASSTGWLLEYALAAPSVRDTVHEDGTQGLSLVTLRWFHDDVMRPRLAALAGVAEVATVGGETSEALLVLRPEALRAAGVAVSDVADALRHRPAGTRFDELAALSIAGGARATPLGELGRIRAARQMPPGMADLGGAMPVVGGIVIVQRDADPIAVAERVRRELDGLRRELPAGAELSVVYDRSGLARRVGGTLGRALAEELAVVVIVVVVFLLHGRSALVPLATLALVLALTAIAMAALGISATVMSLGGIAIALGLAFDADLVALEACHRQLERGGGDRRAQLVAAASTFAPAIATALAIAGLAFLPAFAFTGETGRLLRPLVLTKTLVIAAAIAVTVVVGPALRDRLVVGRIVPELANPLTRALVRAYRPFVHFALSRPRLTLATAALFAASCLPLLGKLGGEFLPRIDEGDLLYMPTASPELPPDVAARELAQQDRVLAQRPEIARVFGKVGRAETATDPAPCSMAETIIRLRPRRDWPLRHRARWYSSFAPAPLARALGWLWPEDAPLTQAELVEELDRALARPGWTNAWTAPVRARLDMMATGVRTPLAAVVTTRDPARLDAIAGGVRAVLARVPGARSASYESLGGATRWRFVPDSDALARHDVDEAAARAVADLVLGGGAAGEVERDGRRVPLRLITDIVPRPPDELLRAATVRGSPGGRPVALALVGRVETVHEPATLRTERGRAVAYVDVDLRDGSDVEGYVARARADLASAIAAGELALDPDETIEWTGQYRLSLDARHRFWILAPIVLAAMLVLLAWQLRSIGEALIVLAAVPFALVGSVWLIFLLDYRLSAPVWVGLLSVVGLAMQTGLIMVVYIDDAFYRRLRAGQLRGPDDIVAAHAEGTIGRLRPKVMTVATMVCALLPLLWSQGAGAEIMKRVAAPMVGGLVSSAFVTLEVIPVLYTLWRQRQLVVANRRGVALEAVIGSAPGWADQEASSRGIGR